MRVLSMPYRRDDIGLADLTAEYLRLIQIVAEEGPVVRTNYALGLFEGGFDALERGLHALLVGSAAGPAE